MSDFKTVKGKTPKAWKVLIYGTPGAGKSSLATHAPAPFFLDLEGGLDRVDCHKSQERLTTYDQVMGALRWAAAQADILTIVIDTVDELDQILTTRVCVSHGKGTLLDFPFGKGGEFLALEWRNMIDVFEKLRGLGKNVLLIGHEQVVKFEDPSSENYDRYLLKIHKKSAAMVTAKMDAVLFARYEHIVRDKEDGRGKRAIGGERQLHCLEAPAWVAKNRFGLPAVVPMTPSIFTQLV